MFAYYVLFPDSASSPVTDNQVPQLLERLGNTVGELMVQGLDAADDEEALSLLVRNGYAVGDMIGSTENTYHTL